MNYRSAIAAIIVGLCPAAVWAGTETDARQDAQQTRQQGSSPEGPSAASGWQYTNGRATPSDQEMGGKPAADLQDAASQNDEDQVAVQGGNQQNQPSANSDDANGQAGQSVGIQGLPDGMEDKLVVILPNDWQGSLPDLLAALEKTSESSEILVLKREQQDDEDSAENSEDDDDSYGADSR